jgi:hypothetical protein
MSEPLERLEVRLKLAGWVVGERHELPADAPQTREFRWQLTSTRVPLHAQAELRLRVMGRWHTRDYWDAEPYYFDDYLTAVSIRTPQMDGATPEAEATLVGDEIPRENYRQLVRILEWFRDPLSGDFWHDPPRPGEWEPPAGTTRATRQAALEWRWNTYGDAPEMLRFMPGKASERKLRLIACACARLLIVPNIHQHNRNAIDAAERYAEGLCPRRELKQFCKHSDLPWLAAHEPIAAAREAIFSVLNQQTSADAARAADVVREILGDPFRPVTLRHEWLRNEGRAVAHLAAAIHDEGRYEDMPILADALEDAGCTVAAVLDHCRAPVRHARGCWVVDLLLGKG